MEVTLTPEQEEILSRIAERTGRNKADLLVAAADRLQREYQLREELIHAEKEMESGQGRIVSRDDLLKLVDVIHERGSRKLRRLPRYRRSAR